MGEDALSFSWWTALLVFAAYCLIDWMMAFYTVAVVQKRAYRAANSGALIYFLTAYGVINYTQNWVYVFFIVLGSWTGTYVYVQRRK